MNRDPALRHPLLARLADARRTTDALFDIVKPEFLYERPIAERHRIVFYIGHLEAFDRNLFDQRLFDLPSPNPEYDTLFAFGIDPVDGGLPTDQPHEWPSLEAIRAYTQQIRDAIDARFDPSEITKHAISTADADPATLLEVAIEHRLMHAETLAYMLHQLPLASEDRTRDQHRRGAARGGRARHGARAGRQRDAGSQARQPACSAGTTSSPKRRSACPHSTSTVTW